MRNAISNGVFAAVLAASAATAQTAPESVTVKRPDGSIVYPAKDGGDGVNSATARDSTVRADDRERQRQEAQESAEERIERSRREREAATTSPARQIPPTTYPR